MKILSIHLARAIWLGHMADFNPKGTNLYRVLFPFLVDTYKFRKFPPMTEMSDLTKGIVFQGGEFAVGEELPIAINLTIYNDGFIADSGSSTDHSEMFLADAFEHFSQLCQIPDTASIIRKRVYLSQLYVHTDRLIEFLNPKLKQISDFLTANVEEGSKQFQTGGISFWSDQIYKVTPAAFSFERTANVPFSENRYFSSAPLPTDKHIELLDRLEGILS